MPYLSTMSDNPEEHSVVYEKRPIWHSPPWITAIVGLVGTFLTVPDIVGNYFQQKQEIEILETKNQGARQEQELGLVKATLAQQGTERVFLLRYISATADDDDARNWAKDEVGRFVQAGVSLKEQLGILENAEYSLDLQFNPSAVTLSPQNRVDLDSVVEQWKGATDLRVVVSGHTSNIPISTRNTAFPSNWHLSQARADVVADYLSLNLGLEREKIIAEGRGDVVPIVSNETQEGRDRNDRVEIAITGRRK